MRAPLREKYKGSFKGVFKGLGAQGLEFKCLGFRA